MATDLVFRVSSIPLPCPFGRQKFSCDSTGRVGSGGFGQAIGNIMQGTDVVGTKQTVHATLARTWRFSDQMQLRRRKREKNPIRVRAS